MKAKPVTVVPGSTVRVADPSVEVTPERIEIHGESYFMGSANGLAIVSVTASGEVDPSKGRLSIMVYRRAHGGMTDGLALLRTMSPDDAEEIARNLMRAAADARATAAAAARDALRKAGGR